MGKRIRLVKAKIETTGINDKIIYHFLIKDGKRIEARLDIEYTLCMGYTKAEIRGLIGDEK